MSPAQMTPPTDGMKYQSARKVTQARLFDATTFSSQCSLNRSEPRVALPPVGTAPAWRRSAGHGRRQAERSAGEFRSPVVEVRKIEVVWRQLVDAVLLITIILLRMLLTLVCTRLPLKLGH